jgi:hypothetical protein
MIPADLLDQLRKKDPGLWERMRRMPIYVHRDSSLTVDLTKSDNTELVAAWLQHCLQEAIRARGWSYRLIWASSVDICKAFICTGPGIHESVNCDTEADALCRAYLTAIQEAA